MLNMQRLDQAAASKTKRGELDVLLTVTAPRERVVLAIIAILILALFAWALFGRMEHGVVVDGVLIEPGPRQEAVSAEPGHLLEFFVVPGDHVEAGDRIARQSVPELEREIAALSGRAELLEREAMKASKTAASLPLLLESTRAALLEMEARRSAKEIIVAHIEGEVVALQSAPGDYLPIGASVARIRGIPGVEAGPTQAVLRVVPSMARRIRPGMQAMVDVAMPGGGGQQLKGEVASVTAGPLPKWLAAMQPATGDFLHRIDIAFHQAPEWPAPNGAAVRVRIVLGESHPVALLDSERF